MKIITVCLLLNCFTLIRAANILAIFTLASPSHHIWNSPLVSALASKGHNVTVISAIPQKTKLTNLTDLVIPNLIEETQEGLDFFEMGQISIIDMQSMIVEFGIEICRKTKDSEAWAQLMAYPPETKFDLLIIESFASECVLGSLQKFGSPPIVVVNAFYPPIWMLQMLGSPNLVSYMPHCNTEYTDQMSFKERAINLFYTAYTYFIYNYVYLPESNKIAKEHFGPEIPSSEQMFEKVSLGLANFHPAMDFSWPRNPNLIPVAGIQVSESKPLPQDLKKFLDDAKEGAIIFSLGTNVKSENLPQEKRQAILDAFKEVPQKVLWKFETENLPGQPKNVKTVKWLPQSDILAHPNVKLFITHSGLLSIHEAIYRGVPVLGIPIFGDQPINIQKIVNLGAGVRVNYPELTKETLLNAIKKVLQDQRYSENMKTLSKRIRDDPETPLERAVFWTEYVIRHKGAYHLRSAALDLNMVQYLLLDVIALVLAIPAFLMSVLYCLCCRRKSLIHTKLKKTN